MRAGSIPVHHHLSRKERRSPDSGGGTQAPPARLLGGKAVTRIALATAYSGVCSPWLQPAFHTHCTTPPPSVSSNRQRATVLAGGESPKQQARKRPSSDAGAFLLPASRRWVHAPSVHDGRRAGAARLAGLPLTGLSTVRRPSPCVMDSCSLPESAMKRNLRAFRQLDQLDSLLAQTLREVRFVAAIVDAVPAQPIEIGSDSLTAVMAHIAQRLEDARGLVQEEISAMR